MTSVLDDDEQGKQRHREIGQKDELVLVHGGAFLASSEQFGVKFVAEKFEYVCSQQEDEKDADVGHEGQFRHGTGDIGCAEHDESGGDGQHVVKQHERRHTVFEELALALDDGEVTLGEQRSEKERHFSPESDEDRGDQQQQETKHERQPVIGPHDGVPIELCRN